MKEIKKYWVVQSSISQLFYIVDEGDNVFAGGFKTAEVAVNEVYKTLKYLMDEPEPFCIIDENPIE